MGGRPWTRQLSLVDGNSYRETWLRSQTPISQTLPAAEGMDISIPKRADYSVSMLPELLAFHSTSWERLLLESGVFLFLKKG